MSLPLTITFRKIVLHLIGIFCLREKPYRVVTCNHDTARRQNADPFRNRQPGKFMGLAIVVHALSVKSRSEHVSKRVGCGGKSFTPYVRVMLETAQLTSGEFVKSHGGEHPHDIRFGAPEFGYYIPRKTRRIIEFEPENFHMFTVVSVQTVVRSAPDESLAVLFHHHDTVVRQLLCVRSDLKRIRRCNYAAGHKQAQ